MDSFDSPNILTKTAAQDTSDTQKTRDSPQSSSQGDSNPATPYVNPYPPFPCYPYTQYPYPQCPHLMPRLIPYDPATSFNQWFMSTDLLLSKYPRAVKMKTLLSTLPKDTRFWLQLKGITENSDYDSAKPSILNLMSITEEPNVMNDFFTRKQQPGEPFAQFVMDLQAVLAESTEDRFSPDNDSAKSSILNLMSIMEEPRTMSDFFTRKQQPGESYARFAMALQAILAESTGNRFSPEDQEYLVSNCFIARTYPPSLQTHLRPLERAGIVELVKAANNFATTLGNHNHPKTSPCRNIHDQPKSSSYRHPRPTRAIQGKYEIVRMYTLNVGNCPVLKVSIEARAHKFLVDTEAVIVDPGTIPARLRNRIDKKTRW